MAALQAEYLRQKGRLSWGAEAFAEISPNIAQEEKNLKLDTGMFIIIINSYCTIFTKFAFFFFYYYCLLLLLLFFIIIIWI
jgi:hypothetical protein